MTENKTTQTAIGVAALAVVIVLVLLWPREKPPDPVKAALAGVPLVMHTSGGRLEVATVKVVEGFKLADPKELLGISLGTTVSDVQVAVVYRYHIEMAKEWPIKLVGQTALVEAGEIKPQLPVAFDTRTMEKNTSSGWARFDKHDNLERLEKSLSPMLEARAPGYKKLAVEAARKSVSDFVTKWLLKYHPLEHGAIPRVEVVFPGEVSSAQRASGPTVVQP